MRRLGMLRPKRPFRLLSSPDTELPAGSLRIKYAALGDPRNPAVLICPSMSNSVHVVDGEENGKKVTGWWNKVVGHGEGYGIDLDKFYVVTSAPLGSPHGSTSPLTPRGASDSDAPWKNKFPQITPLDMAAHQAVFLDELGIDKVLAVVGGSMGGMQALHFATTFPDRYDVFCGVATTAQTSPGTVALRSVQRAAVRMDPDFANGEYLVNPSVGLGLARMFGTICYRSPVEFNNRFDWAPTRMESGQISFEVERYLQHQAIRFTKDVNYDANCYLLLSQAMDMMNIGSNFESYDDAVRNIPCEKEGLLLSYNSDKLTPPEDMQRFSSILGSVCAPVHFEILDSELGHDAFLVEREAQHLNVRLKAFLEGPPDGRVDAVRRMLKDLFGH